MSLDRLIESNVELQYPTSKPTYDLNFTRRTLSGIDPAYSFTRNSSATYVGPDGFIKTAVVNQPRFDFDPVTGEYKGLLIEEGRTNLLTYSTTFDVAWTDTNIIRNTTTALAPDGTNSALRVTAGNDNATIIRNTAVGSNNYRTFSIYLRRVSGSGLIQFTFDGGSSWTTITQSITDKWSRFILSTNFTNHRVGLRIVTAGDSIELWGSQLEVGTFPTSYIPTTSSAVTRQPDQLILNKPLSTQGTLYVESRPTTGVPLVADNGSSSLSVSQNPNQYSKSVLYYNTNRILTMSSDGGVPVDFSSFFAPQDLNRVSLGFDRLNNSSYINGHFKKFSYYSSPLSEDNLRALTGNKRSITRVTRFTNLGEPIVTSGLVLYLDAGNPASYPGSGTTWYDLSGRGNNGILINGPTYSSANGGSLSFDGVDDYVDCGKTATQLGVYDADYTFDAWVYPTDFTLSDKTMFGTDQTGAARQGLHLVFRGGSIYQGHFASDFSAGTGTLNAWNHICFTYVKSSGLASIYKNGVLQGSGTISSFIGTANILIGRWASIRYFNGNISQASIYNRALTAQEIQQNYNALRGRFDI
jgi:hypothetical protein